MRQAVWNVNNVYFTVNSVYANFEASCQLTDCADSGLSLTAVII
jgi:hypothetical protein